MYKLFTGVSIDEYRAYLRKYVVKNNSRLKDLITKIADYETNVNTVLNEDVLTKRESVELIALCRLDAYNESSGGGNKAAEDETDRLYAKNTWKFVEEFLQNADDCEYKGTPQVEIVIDEKEATIEFIYNEKGFSKNDISAITAFSQSTKNNDIIEYQSDEGVFYREKTGRKGKGFKSVYSLQADNIIVHIRSNGYCFKLDKNIGRILPIWEEDPVRMDGKTHVIVKLVNPGFDLKEIYPKFKTLFCVDNCENIFATSPFIFMHRIKAIHIKRIYENDIEEFKVEYVENNEKTVYKNEITVDLNKTILAGIANKGKYYEEQFQEGYIKVQHNFENKPDIHVVRYTKMIEDELAYRNYSIMAPVLTSDDGFVCKKGSLFRTFPMSNHSFIMPMAIDAPFELNPDRSGIQYRDEKMDTINSSKWNSVVSNNLFKSNGVYESFLLWIRGISGLRIDKYMPEHEKNIPENDFILFNNGDQDDNGQYWVPKVDIRDLSKRIPVFRLFANENEYVCLNDAKVVKKDLFSWPCVNYLFSEFFGDDYDKHIISGFYVSSPLFKATSIDKKGFVDSINRYLDRVEEEMYVDSQEMFEFVNKLLYPYLVENTSSIVNAESDAFKRMKIYFSRLQKGNSTVVVRESYDRDTIWINDANKHTSINKYRVVETSPVDMSRIVKNLKIEKIDEYFSAEKINKTASNCKDLGDVYTFIEAAYHFGADISGVSFKCLNNYVLSERYDSEYNAFREAGVKEIIPDEKIVSLSRYADSEAEMAEKIKKMGLKQPKEFFEIDGSYLQLRKDTLKLLKSDIDLSSVLNDIYDNQKQINKKINVTYDAIKKCKKTAIAFLLKNQEDLFSIDTSQKICDELQKEEEYWVQEDDITTEILIRACAGVQGDVSHKDKRIIEIKIDKVLSQHLENSVECIVSENRIGKLKVLPGDSFTEIPSEEIHSLLKILKPDTEKDNALYFKGDMGSCGGKKQYLKDSSGHIYLNCDDKGDYKNALSECINKSFDIETLKAINEMEQQYSSITHDILEMNSKVGCDWNRTYIELEKRFGNYTNKKIISILSYFRRQGYVKAFGNGNINNEKSIDRDYREAPWKFIYEFIQNVDDCNFSEETPCLDIKIDKQKNNIVFEYNETGFTLEDIKALTKFGDSSKTESLESMNKTEGVFDREKTGHKGIGFKSVFSLPGQGVVVHICSNGFSFKFVKRLGSIIPIWEDVDDMPAKGTRITVEGFDSKYLPKLTDDIERMFGVIDISNFYSTCPVLYLRKLNKVSVNNCGKEFSIEIKPQKENSVYSEENYEPKNNEIVAGIIKDGSYKKSLWERVYIRVINNCKVTCFNSVRYTAMFSCDNRTRIASVFAPVINKSVSIDFKKGALYRTLPLDRNTFDLPLSINASFKTNNERSAVADTKSSNDGVLKYVFETLINDFFMNLREVDDVDITKFIPEESVSIFSGYKEIKEQCLLKLIRRMPILKSYIGDKFVSCDMAVVLFKECYKWASPEILVKCFSNGAGTLVKKEYIGLSFNNGPLPKCIRKIDFRSSCFVENLNRYLDYISLEGYSLIEFLNNSIYPYINKHYKKIAEKYMIVNKKHELSNMSIFVFEMADGGYVRESLQAGSIWMTDVPNGYDSYGEYRNIANSSVAEIYDSNQWIKELGPKIVPFDKAFANSNLKSSKVEDWEKTAELIKTILYYQIENKPNIHYLSNCVLADAYDSEDNLFRDGFINTKNEDIIKHIIDTDDLLNIAEITGKTSDAEILELAQTIKSMGLKRADDFFGEPDEGMYKLNKSTIALLESYCVDRESAGKVVSAITQAFEIKKSEFSKSQLRIVYKDIKQCNYLVLAKILEYKIITGETQESLASDFCETKTSDLSMDYLSMDYKEAFFRALAVIKKSPVIKKFDISLSDIIDRNLGECIQQCKLKNLEDISIHIDVGDEVKAYQSDKIDKALQWLEDDSKVSVTYSYYTGNISAAFTENDEDAFLFDDEKVILNAETHENSLIKFVQKRYKGNDSSFKSLVEIITQQNRLKSKWMGTKEEYIESLSKFRESTEKQVKLLVPNYEDNINNSNGQPVEYVIPELLQNINDCRAADGQATRTLEVNISTSDGTMILTYDEAGFDYENVYSITAIGQSSKHDKSEGEKGLGFKKVFEVFSEVEIYSNGFCFKLTYEKKTVPKWIASKDKQKKYLKVGKTVMFFTVKPSQKSKLDILLKDWNSIMNGEYVGNNISPLFLSSIDYIKLIGCEKTYSRADLLDKYIIKRVQILPQYEKMLLESEVDDYEEQLKSTLDSLKLRKKCQSMSDKDVIEDYLNSLEFELALPRKAIKDHVGKGCFYSTLPTKRNIGVPMFMNIPLELTTGRDDKIDSSEYNNAIMKLIFKPIGEDNKSIFTILLEEVAKENPEIFMADYFKGDINKLFDEITNHNKDMLGAIKKSLDYAELFVAYNVSSMVSLRWSFSVDKIVCQYLMKVKNTKNDIFEWIKEHAEKAENFNLILPQSGEKCEDLEKFAENIGSFEGYFPLTDSEDLPLLYLMDEYGYVGGDDDE